MKLKTLVIHKIIKNPLFVGSLVMVVGSNLHNAGQLLFHFMTGKLLDEASYGEIATIISILGFVSIVQTAYGLAIVKFLSSQKREKEINNLVYWFERWGIYLATFMALILLAFSPFITDFLHISNPLSVYLLVPAIFFYVLTMTARSILQALLKFYAYVISLMLEVWVKIPIAFGLIYFGFKVAGAMFALGVGIVAAFLVARKSIKNYLVQEHGQRPKIAPIVRYSLPAFIQGISMTSMYTTDLILVKHFFSPETAGVYASLAILGRIVLFGATPVINVMFPLVVRKHSHGLPYHNIFYLSVFMIVAFSSVIVLFYFLFPQMPIRFLYKESYLIGSPYLWWFGLVTLILSLSQLFIQFYLSVGKLKIVWLFAGAAVFQAILIVLFHTSLFQVIQQSLVASSLLLLSMIVYFPYHHSSPRN